MPCFLRRCIRVWKGFISPVSASMATPSPSTMASSALTCSIIIFTASGYMWVMFSILREKISTCSPFLWIWNLSPSSLYSAEHSPSFSMTSSEVERRWADIILMGLPTMILAFSSLSSPPSARVLPTYPRSLVRLYALSRTGLFLAEPV